VQIFTINRPKLDTMWKDNVFLFEGSKVFYIKSENISQESEYGQTLKKHILFLHNGGTSHIIWKPVMAKLESQKHTCIALDLPGFGSSPLPEDNDYDLEKYVAMVSSFIHHLGLNQENSLVLVGNCMGSAISLCLAQRLPKAIHSMVLFNPLTEKTFANGWIGITLWLQVQYLNLN
jgi:pimeloyl-ACP methyl ester carboxylesterase